ncbi:choice-of-anchor Q domain-containing protein [Dokdonella sp.]|uniref:choice-of-anchor Q domain-containing protein n=1 Tax=Dokdonella sp. TaxID=2291710 RepID=UPI001B0A8778|nr:choice-of-anchor Q domain-containing protein [Dokdonella sp.]MBO9665019.1 hypothetical protein [Dokdonella sp.]
MSSRTIPASRRVRGLNFHPLAACLALALATGSASEAAWSSATYDAPGAARLPRSTVSRDLPERLAAQAESERILRQRAAHYAEARALARAKAQVSSRPAGTIAVTSCSDAAGDSGTLRAAVAGAVSGDTIDLGALKCSTISLEQGQVVVPVADLTIQGAGESALTVDGGDLDRVFKHTGAGTLTIRDLTVAHGRHVDMAYAGYFDGGCLYSLGKLALERVTVDSCLAGSALGAVGGGLFAYDLEMTASTVSNSRAEALAAFGGGIGLIVADGAEIAVSSSTIKDNTSSGILAHGGGVTVSASTGYADLTLRSSTVSGNTATADSADNWNEAWGGGIQAANVGLHVRRSLIVDNLAEVSGPADRLQIALGGGINAQFNYFVGDAAVIEDSLVSGNRVVAHGATGWGDAGGLYLTQWHTNDFTATKVTLSRTTVSDNQVSGDYMATRGGVGPGSWLTIAAIDSTISGNRVSSTHFARCGGIEGSEGLSLVSSTVSGNLVSTAETSYGGGVCMYLDLEVANSTIAFNSAGGSGGGVYFRGRPPRTGDRFVSSIVANNQAAAGADLAAGNFGSPGGLAALAGSGNLVASIDASITLPPDTLSADPQLLPLADNGGPTWTHALAPASPAIDAGSNPADLRYDQRGEGYPRSSGAATDIGAFELQPPTVTDRLFGNGFETR